MENLSTVVAVIIALSIASERLVEIVKGLIPALNTKNDDSRKEGWRKATLQFMAVIASIVTALLCQPALAKVMPATWSTFPGILALGLLASGGSGFWNSVLTYVLKLKDVEAATAKRAERSLRHSPGPSSLEITEGRRAAAALQR